MQSPAEQHLISELSHFLKAWKAKGETPRILNVGAGKSTVIENALAGAGCEFTGDRCDVEDCAVAAPMIRYCWECPVEDMSPVPSRTYAAVFANYVLEHVVDPTAAAAEVFRALEPGGLFITTVPNPAAPEFWVARHTPLWFHRWMRRTEAWETRYAYRRVTDLLQVFRSTGFDVDGVLHWSWLGGYLHRFPLLRHLGRAYDAGVSALRIRGLQGQVCASFRKP